MSYSTKGERREQKRNKKRGFKESGRSVFLLQDIIIRKSRQIREKQKNYVNDSEDTSPSEPAKDKYTPRWTDNRVRQSEKRA